MELNVRPEEVCKILHEVRVLLKECLIPRMDKLEYELFCLRRQTWPVCSILTEKSPVDTEWFTDKVESCADDLDYLIWKKNKLSHVINPNEPWKWNRLEDEKNLFTKYKNGNIIKCAET